MRKKINIRTNHMRRKVNHPKNHMKKKLPKILIHTVVERKVQIKMKKRKIQLKVLLVEIMKRKTNSNVIKKMIEIERTLWVTLMFQSTLR